MTTAFILMMTILAIGFIAEHRAYTRAAIKELENGALQECIK